MHLYYCRQRHHYSSLSNCLRNENIVPVNRGFELVTINYRNCITPPSFFFHTFFFFLHFFFFILNYDRSYRVLSSRCSRALLQILSVTIHNNNSIQSIRYTTRTHTHTLFNFDCKHRCLCVYLINIPLLILLIYTNLTLEINNTAFRRAGDPDVILWFFRTFMPCVKNLRVRMKKNESIDRRCW